MAKKHSTSGFCHVFFGLVLSRKLSLHMILSLLESSIWYPVVYSSPQLFQISGPQVAITECVKTVRVRPHGRPGTDMWSVCNNRNAGSWVNSPLGQERVLHLHFWD